MLILMHPPATSTWPLRLLCVLILAVILAAGLWPFHQPPNDVAWAAGHNGMRFGGQGLIFALGPHQPAESAGAGSCALEIWLQPEGARQRGTIIAFYNPADPMDFSLFQEGSGLGLRLHNQKNLEGPHFYNRVNVFHPGRPVFITITSNAKTANVYVDGVLAKTLDFPLAARNLQGQLVAGTFPAASQGWEGQVMGIATYERALTPEEVAHHYETWTAKGRPETFTGTGNLALYLFDEHAGSLVRNALGTGADLHIPRRYAILHPSFLGRARPHLSDWPDTLINIAGFVPLGLFFCAWFSSGRQAALPAVLTILAGFSLSLGMEVLQAYLPDRISDVVDLVTNTLGTAVGVLLYWTSSVRTFLARIGLLRFTGPAEFESPAPRPAPS
jgi:VanZ family protein